MNHNFYKYLLAVFLSVYALGCRADYSVIVNANNTANISKQDVANIFLAKRKTFPDGNNTTPLNHIEQKDARSAFDKKILGKDLKHVKAYWARLIFTGKAMPIETKKSDEEILRAVSDDPNAIGYVESSKVTDDVRVVFNF